MRQLSGNLVFVEGKKHTEKWPSTKTTFPESWRIRYKKNFNCQILTSLGPYILTGGLGYSFVFEKSIFEWKSFSSPSQKQAGEMQNLFGKLEKVCNI